jgi:hypothetical protein
MSRILTRIAATLFGVAVSCALAFGTAQALSTAMTDCPFQPPHLLGACANQAECQLMCDWEWFPEPVTGDCDSENCCHCLQ